VGTPTYTSSVLTLTAYSHFWRTHTSGILKLLAYLHFRCTHAFWCTHTSSVFMSRSYSHALHVFVILTVSVTPGVVSLQSSHTLCVGSLFTQYLSRLAYSSSRPYLHTLPDLVVHLTHLTWTRCCCGICHARCAVHHVRIPTPCMVLLFFSHALCRRIVRLVGVWWLQCWSPVER
jgi:hypothetical protein